MNPMLQEALVLFFKWALAFGAGWFINHGIWTNAQATIYVAGASIGIVSYLWLLWGKYKSRMKFLMALTMPPGTTEDEVKAAIQNGASVPTVTTPPNTVPGVPK